MLLYYRQIKFIARLKIKRGKYDTDSTNGISISNIYKVENPNNFLFIYVTDVEDELVTEEGQKQEFQDKIQEFKENQKSKKDSIYRISIWKDYVCIFNQKYYRLENM